MSIKMISQDEKTVVLEIEQPTAAAISYILMNAVLHYEQTSLDSAGFEVSKEEVREISNEYDRIRRETNPYYQSSIGNGE